MGDLKVVSWGLYGNEPILLEPEAFDLTAAAYRRREP